MAELAKIDAEKYVRRIQEAMILTPREELHVRSVIALAMTEAQKQGIQYCRAELKEFNDEQNGSSNNQD